MASFAKLFAEIFRDWLTDGVPGSGPNPPVKADIRAWGSSVEGAIGLVTTWLQIGGTVNGLVSNPAGFAAYQTGQIVAVTPASTNTGPATLNVASLGVKPIVSLSNTALSGGEIIAGCTVLMVYDGTSWRMLTGIPDLWLTAIGGTANAITATSNPAIIGLGKGQSLYLIPTAANTGAVTLNLNGLGAKNVRTPSGALLNGGELAVGRLYELIYDGTYFRLTAQPSLDGTATFDPASLADGVGATTTVTVTGAALGDFAEASFSIPLSGILMTAWVSAADTVSVRLQNESGGTLDLASGTLRCRVRRA